MWTPKCAAQNFTSKYVQSKYIEQNMYYKLLPQDVKQTNCILNYAVPI